MLIVSSEADPAFGKTLKLEDVMRPVLVAMGILELEQSVEIFHFPFCECAAVSATPD